MAQLAKKLEEVFSLLIMVCESSMLLILVLHGISTIIMATGVYEDGLEHVGIAILLSKHTETSWEKFKKAVEDGIIPDGKLDWYDDV